jgi:hypothetical protein
MSCYIPHVLPPLDGVDSPAAPAKSARQIALLIGELAGAAFGTAGFLTLLWLANVALGN